MPREKRVEYRDINGKWRKSAMNERAAAYFLSLPVGTQIRIVFPRLSGKEKVYRIS